MASTPTPSLPRGRSPQQSIHRLAESSLTNGQIIRRLLRLAWQYKAYALLTLGLQLVLLVMAVTGLGLLGLGVDELGAHVDPDAEPPAWPFGIPRPDSWSPMQRVGAIAAGIFAIAALRFVLDRTNTIALAVLTAKIVVDLRKRVYAKLQRLSFHFFDANSSGSIINRVTGDVQSVRAFIDQVLVQVVMMVVSLAVFLTYMLSINPRLTAACLAATPLMFVLSIWFSKRVKPAYRVNRELVDETIRVLSENVQGHHVVRGFGLEPPEVRKFRKANMDVKRQQRWIFRQVSTFVPLIQAVPMINIVVLLLYGGALYMRGEISHGTLLVFLGLLTQFSNQIGAVAQITNMVQRSLIGGARVFEVLDAEVAIESPPGAVPIERAKGSVVFENATFGYDPDKPAVLEDISLVAEPGETVAILGATGAGKSSLLSLIPRFYDPRAGRVLLDGRDLREYDIADLRRQVGLVFQESFLFSQTVHENIAFGHPDATREQVIAAAKIAQAHDFVSDMPDGYDTVLSESGGNLSGGQRQRLAIARAVLLEPPILLLDDPTAAIDPETEHEILAAMERAMAGRTTFVVAHRLSTLRRADHVIVLDHGRIVQRGTHESLMGDDTGHYAAAASLQVSDAESDRILGLSEGAA
ncbi:MAG: ABC transporter ATP-binding protein [Planctomycetota bacterium]